MPREFYHIVCSKSKSTEEILAMKAISYILYINFCNECHFLYISYKHFFLLNILNDRFLYSWEGMLVYNIFIPLSNGLFFYDFPNNKQEGTNPSVGECQRDTIVKFIWTS